MSSERPSTEEVNTSEEALEAKSPADQEQPETPQESDAGVNEATSSAPAETPQTETPAEPEAAASQEAVRRNAKSS